MLYEEFENRMHQLIYPASDAPDREAKKIEYSRVLGRITEDFKKALEDHYQVTDNPKKDMLWSVAWDYGHASGFYDIEGHYGNLVCLIRD
jgi:hypothetical protein